MNEEQFTQIKKNSAKSFNDQKALIKKVLAGREIKCQQCGTKIQLLLPKETGQKGTENTGLYCGKGCTNIALDFVL